MNKGETADEHGSTQIEKENKNLIRENQRKSAVKKSIELTTDERGSTRINEKDKNTISENPRVSAVKKTICDNPRLSAVEKQMNKGETTDLLGSIRINEKIKILSAKIRVYPR